MTYETNLEREDLAGELLVIMKPRRDMDSASWSVVSGTIYKQSFSLGIVSGVTSDGVALTEAASSALSTDEFFYDYPNSKLYIDVGANPNTVTIVSAYEIYLASDSINWHRVPTDDTTATVSFESILTNPPKIEFNLTDRAFGFMPTFTSALGANAHDDFWEKHLYDSSFNRIPVEIYHFIGDLDVSNFKKLSTTTVSRVQYSDDAVVFSLKSPVSVFDTEWRNGADGVELKSFYTLADHPFLDPSKVLTPIRKVYGRVDKFIPVSLDYEAETPTVNENRRWGCISNDGDHGNASTTVSGSSSTTTRTFLNNADGYNVDDSFSMIVTDGGGGTMNARITAVDKTGSPHFVDHTTIAIPGSNGNSVARTTIGHIVIVRDGVEYFGMIGRDYFRGISPSNENLLWFEMRVNTETNMGLPSAFDPRTDIMYCRVYGDDPAATFESVIVGSPSENTDNLTNGIAIVYDILKDHVGLDESVLDGDTFNSLVASITDELSFAIPERSGERWPTFKEVITDVLSSMLLKLYQDNDGKWTLAQTGPLGAATKTVLNNEISIGTLRYDFDYNDVYSDIIVTYRHREISDLNLNESQGDVVQSTSNRAKYLHNINRELKIGSLHLLEADAQIFADRLKYMFSEHRGEFSITVPKRLFDSEVDDVIEIIREKLPGFTFTKGVENSRSMTVEKISKSLDSVRLKLADQKGIEDNSGSW